MTRSVGIDVGASAIWLVSLTGDGDRPEVDAATVVDASNLDAVASFCQGAAAAAIDAPEERSLGCHLGDGRLAPKFRSARCGEVALLRAGLAVPFVTPTEGVELPTWMGVGFAVWNVVRAVGAEPRETYPHGIFWRLAGRQLLHKQRHTGRAARRSVLEDHVKLPAGIDYWNHDGLDALASALVAHHVAHATAQRIDCSSDRAWPHHDGSGIWLPQPKLPTAPLV